MKNLNKLLYVAERDVDLLLLEEINVCREFATWLYQRVFGESVDVPGCAGAWHSVNHPQLGESDLVVRYDNGSAILVENNVDAPTQPEQAERYQIRGDEGCREGHWQRFVTCMVAPARYLKGVSDAQNYDVQVSYEELRAWFTARDSVRDDYRAYVLSEAIEQNRRGYSPIANEEVTQFWLSYWQLAKTQFASLEMVRPGVKPANADWPEFRPGGLGANMAIVHKMAQGCVDLQVAGAAEELEEIRSRLEEPDLEVVAAGKSAAIRVAVTQVDRFASFEDQRKSVLLALETAQRLLVVAKGLHRTI